MFRFDLRTTAGLAIVLAVPLGMRMLMQQPVGPVLTSPGRLQTAKATPDQSKLNTSKKASSRPAEKSAGENKGPDSCEGQEKLNDEIFAFANEYVGGTSAETPSTCKEWKKSGLNVVIAILPDPVHTRLALRFDRAIDDIENATQSLGGQFDHSWLPWDNKHHSEPDRFDERASDLAEQRKLEDNPGVLFFRPSDTEPRLTRPLVVLVVGDTPTMGVNPEQFRRAIATWKELTAPDAEAQPSTKVDAQKAQTSTPQDQKESPNGKDPKQSNSQTLFILGPSFSGSVQSLGELLKTEPGCSSQANLDIEVISGTVSGGKALENLSNLSDCMAPSKIRPLSFEVEKDYQRHELIEFIKRHDKNYRCAQLTEEESGFGAPDSKGGPQDCETYRFPREISKLRIAYEEDSVVGFGNSSNGPRTQLRFSSGEDTRDDDTVPSFSGKQGTLAMESDMAQMAATLNERHVSTALLSATDALDEIFVANYLKQHSPGVTVIIQDADLLFLRKGDDTGLDNTYVASPWPLIQGNQDWSAIAPDQPTHSLYPSQGDEAMYDAATYLLCQSNSTSAKSCKTATKGILEYRPPFATSKSDLSNRPPIWLSVIEHGRFSPVALVNVDQIGTEALDKTDCKSIEFNLPCLLASTSTSPATARPYGINSAGYPNLLLKLVTAFIAILLLWHIAACVLSRVDLRFAWTYALADLQHHCPRLALQTALTLLVIPALALLRIPSVEGIVVQGMAFRVLIYVLQFFACAFASWLVFRISRGVGGPANGGNCILPALIALIFLSISIALSGLFDHFLWTLLAPSRDLPTERLFFFYRCSTLLSGSSPSLTILMLFAACAYWLHSHFGKLVFFGHRIPLAPNIPDDNRIPGPGELDTVSDLFSSAAGWNAILAFLSVLVVAIVLVISGEAGPRSLAHGGFDWCVCALTFVLAVVILHELAMAVCGWYLLRHRCLIPLKQSPLRWGFTWIKGFSWRRIWTSSRALSPESLFDYMWRLENANQRAGTDPALESAFRDLTCLRSVDEEKKDDLWAARVAKQVIEVHRLLAKVAEKKLAKLKVAWKEDHGAVTGHEDVRGMRLEEPIESIPADDKKRVPALDRMANEEFVALLYLGYISMVLIQIRNRIVTASVMYILFLWALTSYPWMNRQPILIALSALLVLISAVALYVYSDMHHDDILSRTTVSAVGKLDTAFFEKIIPTIGIPLLTLVASQFPQVSNFIFSWLEPSLRGQ